MTFEGKERKKIRNSSEKSIINIVIIIGKLVTDENTKSVYKTSASAENITPMCGHNNTGHLKCARKKR